MEMLEKGGSQFTILYMSYLVLDASISLRKQGKIQLPTLSSLHSIRTFKSMDSSIDLIRYKRVISRPKTALLIQSNVTNTLFRVATCFTR
jgi:hypothetical protein